ncbi:MAG: hypothetical protein IJ503_09665, partial [Akkermansia sp.]|nr:hypothetical protein [Akkermansia sp.]
PAHFVRGSDMFFVLPSVPPRGGSTLGYYYVALTGSEFLGLSARQIPIYRALFSNFGTHVSIQSFSRRKLPAGVGATTKKK